MEKEVEINIFITPDVILLKTILSDFEHAFSRFSYFHHKQYSWCPGSEMWLF